MGAGKSLIVSQVPLSSDPETSMTTVHICPLGWVEATVAQTRASHLVSILRECAQVQRPPAIPADRHLTLEFDDITFPFEGARMPEAEHIERLLTFVAAWDRGAPLVIHCRAGISRSTAAAFITACALAPTRDEAEIASELR